MGSQISYWSAQATEHGGCDPDPEMLWRSECFEADCHWRRDRGLPLYTRKQKTNHAV